MADPEARRLTRPRGSIRAAGPPALLAALVLALTGGLSLWLGQDLNFDLLNYHYYAGYAFLHGRTFSDLAPAGSQSFLPPLINVFHYLGIAHLPPRVFGFLLGSIHGLNVLLIFALGFAVLPRDDPRGARVVAVLAAVVGSLGPAAVSLLGTTFGDNLVSIPAALALLLVLATGPDANARWASWLAFAAGVLGGAALGLKLPMAVYQLGLLVAAGALWWRSGSLAKRLGMLSLGSLLGYLPTGGFWASELQRDFGNPVFPFANNLFRSEYQSLETGMVERLSYGLVRPVVDMALGRPGRLAEITMRDVRFLLLLVAGIGCAAVGAAARARGSRREPWSAFQRALLAWWLTAYVAWALMLSTYRYVALLEFTAPLVLFLVLRRLAPARHALACRRGGRAPDPRDDAHRVVGAQSLADAVAALDGPGIGPATRQPDPDGRPAERLRHPVVPRGRTLRAPHRCRALSGAREMEPARRAGRSRAPRTLATALELRVLARGLRGPRSGPRPSYDPALRADRQRLTALPAVRARARVGARRPEGRCDH